MKILMFFIMFLMLGAFFIISNEKIILNNGENVKIFLKEYGSWIDDLVVNGKSVAGHVIKMDWLPEDNSKSG